MQTFEEQVQLLPPSVHHVSAFIANCFQSNLAASTTRTLISSLSFKFKLGDFSNVTQHFIIKKMLQGYQKCKPSTDARLPFTSLILGKLVNALEHTTSSPFLRALLRAMFIRFLCRFTSRVTYYEHILHYPRNERRIFLTTENPGINSCQLWCLQDLLRQCIKVYKPSWKKHILFCKADVTGEWASFNN